MKVKTSVSLDEELIAKLKVQAKKQDRSVSYVLEKFIELCVRELPDAEPKRGKNAKAKYTK